MVSEMGRKVFEKINKQKGKVLGEKMDQIDALLKPYTTISTDGKTEFVNIPDDGEDRIKYEKLDKEFKEIVSEINLMDKN